MKKEEFEKLMEKARKTNSEMTTLDKKAGFAPPEEVPIRAHLATAAEAIRSGLSTMRAGDTSSLDCIAQGLALLEDAIVRIDSGIPLSGMN